MSVYTVANWTNNKTSADASSPLVIQDTAANIQAALSTLTTDSHISQIVAQDSPGVEVSISVAQITAYASALAILKNLDGSAASVIVSDTAANIGSNFAVIATDAQVSSIQISNNLAVTLTASQLSNNLSAIPKLVNANTGISVAVIVKDTAANLVTYLNNIQTVISTVSQIVVSNNTQLTLTASQVNSDSAALAKVRYNNNTTTNLFKVSDTAANIGLYLDALAANAKITAISISDSAAVPLTVAQITADTVAIGKLANAAGGGYSLSVTDSASNLSAVLDTLALNSHVSQIVISNSVALTVSVAQIASDAAKLAVTTNQGGGAYTLIVVDTAANIGPALSTLTTNTHVANIEVTSGTVALTSVAALTSDATALGVLHQADGTTQAQVVVTDTAANISAALNSLHANSQVLKLVISDSASHQVAASVAQLTTDSDVLAKLYQADASTPAPVTVSDTGDNLSHAVLATVAGNAQVNRIVVASGAVQLTVAEWGADSVALAELYNPDASSASVWIADIPGNLNGSLSTLTAAAGIARIVVSSGTVQVNAATAASAPALAKLYTSGGVLASVSVSDTAANLSTALDALNGNTRVNAIVVASGGALTLSASQVATDTTALGEITGGYTIAVTDTASAVATNLAALHSNVHVTSIALSDGGTPTLTLGVAAFLANAATVGLISGVFTLDVTGVPYGQLGNVEAAFNALPNSGGLAIEVSDSAANLTHAALGTLGGDNVVLSIAISTGTLALTEAQFVADLTGLTKIVGAWSVSVSGVAFVDVATVESDFAALGGAAGGTLTIAVSDTAAHLAPALSTLGGDSAVLSIAVTTGGPISLTESQFIADLAGLAKITGAWSLDVTGATVAQVSIVESDFAVLANAAMGTLSITVSDSGTNLTDLALQTLGLDGTVASVAVSSGSLALTASEFVAAPILYGIAKISGAWNVDVAGANVALVPFVESAFQGLSNAGSGTLSIAVTDVSDALTSTALIALGNDNHVASIAVSSGTLSFTEAEFVGATNLAGLAKITGAWSASVSGAAVGDVAAVENAFSGLANTLNGSLSIAVSDVAGNLGSAALVSLGVDTHVQSIVSSGTLSLTETQFNAAGDQLGLGKIASYTVNLTQAAAADAGGLAATAHVGTIVVDDTSGNIQLVLDDLNVNGKVTSIIISDNAALAMTAYAATHDSVAIGLLHNQNSSAVSLTVSDTAAQVALYFDQLALETNISSIVISDNAPLNLSAAQIADASTIAKLHNLDTSGVVIDVLDTAAHISANLTALETEIDSSGFVSQVTISDNASITVSLAQRAADQTVLGLLQNANDDAVSLIVEDTAQNILNNSVTLAQDSVVTSVLISDNAPLLLSVAQYQSDAALLAKLHNADSLPYVVDIADNAANISGMLVSVNNDAHIARINVSGNGALAVNVAGITNYAAVLSKIYNGTDTSVSTYTLAVTDTASNLAAAFGALSSNAHVATIVVSDSAQNEVTLSATAALADTVAEGELFLANATTPAHVAVSDVASTLSTDFDTLNSNAHVDKITVASGGAVALSVTQFTADTTAIGELQGGYQLAVTGSAASVTGATLDALQLNGHVSSLTISDNQEISVTVARLASDSTVLGRLVNANMATPPVIVADTAAQIQAAFSTLNGDTMVNKLVVTDSGSNQVTISVSALNNSVNALAELYAANGATPGVVTVSDTASAISGSFPALNTSSAVDRIIVTDSGSAQVTLSAANAVADTHAEGELYQSDNINAAQVAVSDTAAAISTNFDMLNSNTHVGSLTLSDVNPLALSAGQVAGDTRALAAFTAPYTIAVTDTSSNVAQYLNALEDNASIVSIVVSDNSAITLDDSIFERDQGAIAIMTRGVSGPQAQVMISDTFAAISGDLPNLVDSVAEIASVALTSSGTFQIGSIANFTTDASVLAKISGAYTLAVSGLGGAITGSALDSLESYATAGHLASLTVSDSADITATVAEITADAGALAVTNDAGGGAYTLAIADTAAHVGVALDALAQNTHVDTITLSDPASVMTITAAQYAGDGALFAKINSGYHFSVTGVTVANAASVALGAHVTSVAVSDTGNHVDAGLDSLQGLGASITVVTLTDASAPTLSVTYAQLTADAGILGKIGSSFSLAVTGVSASQATGVATLVSNLGNANATLGSIAISDASANVQTSLPALIGLGAAITSVAFTDMSPALSLTETQYNTTAALRSGFSSPYSLTVTGVAAADAVGIATDSHVTGLTISDSSSAIATHFDDLNGLIAEITQVAFTDGSPALTITDAQYNASAALRAEFVGSNLLTVTGALVSEAANLLVDAKVAHFTILDSASNVQANLSSLNGQAKITAVAFTGPAAALSVTETQYGAWSSLIGKFTGSYTLTVTSALAADAATIASDSHVTQVAISDTSANVQANLPALIGLGTKVSSVAFTDGSPALTLTGGQYDGSTTLRAGFAGSYALTVTGAAAADASTFASDSHVAHFSITDSAAQVQAAFDTLAGLSAKVTGVSFTDVSPSLTLTESQYNASTALRLQFPIAYTLTVTNAVVADQATILNDAHVTHLGFLDSALNVQANLSALILIAPKITQVSFTDGSPALTMTEAQYNLSAALRAEFSGSYALTVTGVAAADVATIGGDSHVAHLTVSDSSANLQTNFSAVNGLASKITSVVFTDGSPSLTLTETQYNCSSTLRAAFPATYSLALTGVAAADATGLVADSHISSLAVADTAAHVQSSLAALQGVIGKVGAITLSDGQRPTLTITEGQYTADWPIIQKIASSFNLTVSGVAVADLASLITTVSADASVHTLAIDVSDTAANIAAALGSLNASQVQAVSISDNGSLVFTASAAANGASALGKLSNQNSSPLSLAVSDTAAQISANFSSLSGISLLSAITVSDDAALTLTGAQLRDGALALSKTVNADSSAPVLDVVDTATGIEAAGVLDALEGNNELGSIVVSGGPLVVSVAQLLADGDVIAEMTDAGAQVKPVTVADTAANIAASLGVLALDPQVTAIQLTSGGQITLSIAQLNAYQSALAELQGATLLIKDTAAALQGSLDQLQALGASVSSVVVSNNLPMTISAVQVANDSATLAKLSNRSGAPVTYNVVDTGAHVTTALSALTANVSHVGTITLTSGAVSVGATAYQANHAALDKIVGGFTLTDAAANIASLFDTANSDASVHAITLTDAGVPVLNISPSSAASDTAAIAAISNPLFEILTSQGGTYYANGGGSNNQLVVSNNSVHVVEKTLTNLAVSGHDDTISAAANATLSLSGNAMIVTAGAGDAVTLLGGTGDQFTGSNDTLTIAGDAGLSLSGSGNAIGISASHTLTLTGNQTLAAAVSGAGTLALSTGAITLASGTTLAMGALSEGGSGTSVSIAGDLSYGGALTQNTGGSLTEASAHTLTLTGTSTLSGTIAGAGTLALTGGSTTFAAGAVTTIAHWSIQGAATSATIGAPRTYSGAFSAGQGATIVVTGGVLTLLGGSASFTGATVGGANNISDFETTSVSGLTVAGSSAFTNYAALTQSGGSVTIGDSSASTAKVVNQAAGVWNLTDNNGIAAAGSSVKLINYGLLEKTGGSGTSVIGASFTSSGSIIINSGTLSLTGTGDTLSGSITGSGGLAISGAASIGAGTVLSVTSLTELGTGATLSFGAVSYAGSLTQGAGSYLYAGGGVLTLTGSSSLGGTVSGAGAIALAGGTTIVTSATKLFTTTMSEQGASTVLNVTGAISRMSNFSVTGGATINLSGGNLSLSGTGLTLSGANVVGSYTLANVGALSVAGLTVGGAAVLSNSATLTQSGGAVTLGDSSVSTAKITNAAAGAYNITDNSGIASASTATRFTNAGLFEKTGGGGISLIAPVFSNTGQITVSSGTLEFGAAYTGAGVDTVAGAATLAFDSTVGSGATIAFTGSGGHLTLGNAHGFAGALSGFDTVGSNDAVALLGSWSSTGFTENGGHTQGVLQLTNGTQSASLTFNGNYANNFHVLTSGGSTAVTYG